jgi:hypothetical protein
MMLPPLMEAIEPVVYIVYIMISAFAHRGLRTMSKTCLDRPKMMTINSGTLAGLALCILKIGPPVA